jgi:DNA polymerase-1
MGLYSIGTNYCSIILENWYNYETQPAKQAENINRYPNSFDPNKLKIAQWQLTLKNPYQLIDTAFNLEIALQPFQRAKIIGIDCETTGLDPYQAKIRLLQLAIPDHPVIIVDL